MRDPLYLNSQFPEGLDRTSAVFICALAHIDSLKRKGLIEGGAIHISEQGRALFAELQSLGFQPSTEELCECVASMQEYFRRGGSIP